MSLRHGTKSCILGLSWHLNWRFKMPTFITCKALLFSVPQLLLVFRWIFFSCIMHIYPSLFMTGFHVLCYVGLGFHLHLSSISSNIWDTKVKMRGDCSFCWYWWNWWPSLFKCLFCWYWWNWWPSLFKCLFCWYWWNWWPSLFKISFLKNKVNRF